MKSVIGIVSKDPMDYVKVALAIETLAYHNKNYLAVSIAGSSTALSWEIQYLLEEAVKKSS